VLLEKFLQLPPSVNAHLGSETVDRMTPRTVGLIQGDALSVLGGYRCGGFS